jgi:thiosulfate/3-mercaptopyruvate sulfurtransferase
MGSGLISTEEFSALRAGGPFTLLDVRGMPAYLKGHIPGAACTRWQEFVDPDSPVKGLLHPDSRELARLFGALGVADDRPVVVYSEPFEYWGSEGRFFWMLHYLGHDDVRILDGGFPKWRREGREIAHMPTRPAPAAFAPVLRMGAFVDRAGVEACLNDRPDALLLDARSSDEYRKEGHIPGAVNLPWSVFYREDGTLRPEDELRRIVAAAGITPEREVIPYCTGGVRSAWVFFVLHRLGFQRLRNYDGSWWDWTADPALPVER